MRVMRCGERKRLLGEAVEQRLVTMGQDSRVQGSESGYDSAECSL